MGRSKKMGLEYFPFDINLFYDIKVRKLVKYQGGKAITVYAYLLCRIYENGYYMEWDKELPFICAEITGYDEAYVSEALKCCINVGLFDRELFEKYNVLSSAGIQSRYCRIVAMTSKRKCTLTDYSLLDDDTDCDTAAVPTEQSKPAPKARGRKPAAKVAPLEPSTAQPEPEHHTDELPQPAVQPSKDPVQLTDAIATLSHDAMWYEPVCMRYRLSENELLQKLDEFKLHCQCMGTNTHQSLADAKRHFCLWLSKSPKQPKNQSSPSQPDPNDNGSPDDFGAADY